jgi:hydroxyethylthiazole kinase-like uncharacterized protein yjeF
VIRAWRGLGYNRRAIALRAAAIEIVRAHDGVVPDDLAQLQALPGIGPYTARAVLAIAFGRPVAALDTNIRRVVGRVAGADARPRTIAGERELQRLADGLVPGRAAARWTHALMDIGAAFCRPRAPRCDDCPLVSLCVFAKAGEQADVLPRRAPSGSSQPFRGTSRWLRGRILDRLRDASDGSWVELRDEIGGHSGAAVEPAAPASPADPVAVRLGYDPSVMSASTSAAADASQSPLPADDPQLFDLDLRGLRRRWAEAARKAPIGAEAMSGADRRAQAMGVPGQRLMEHAGTAVAAAVKAIAVATDRWGKGPILILAGPGNNGGDGFVAARHLARAGADVIAVLVSTENLPSTPDAARNWHRLDRDPRIRRVHVASATEVGVLAKDVDRVAVAVDALLGTGVRGVLREPVRSAVGLIGRARAGHVPVVAVDTPTAVDLTSGDPTDPVVQADLTVTFHRPKTGLQTRRGAALAGKVLVAPIGIPREADRG